MNDELHDLLRRADETIPVPPIDPTDLPGLIRRSVRNQHRLTACGLAIGSALLLLAIPVISMRPHPATIAKNNPAPFDVDTAIHERTAAILLANTHRAKPAIDPRDAFLNDLRLQRNRAALLLLHDASHEDPSDPSRVATLQRTIDLFPDTPAAAVASQQLQQPNPPRRQS